MNATSLALQTATQSIAKLLPQVERTLGRVHVTPLHHCAKLSKSMGRRIQVKCEFLQYTGSFKFRGALAACTREVTAGATHLVASSTGNFGIGVAAAGAALGVPVTVFVPKDAPKRKQSLLSLFSANVVAISSEEQPHAYADAAEQYAASRHLTYLSPYDDAHVIAAHSLLILEIERQLAAQKSDQVSLVLPVGGGSLLAGALIALRAESRIHKIVGVEPRDLDDFARSIRSGEISYNRPTSRSVCDALSAACPGRLTFEVARENPKGLSFAQVSDDDVMTACALLQEDLGVAVEPSSAACLAAACKSGGTDNVVIVATGGNS